MQQLQIGGALLAGELGSKKDYLTLNLFRTRPAEPGEPPSASTRDPPEGKRGAIRGEIPWQAGSLSTGLAPLAATCFAPSPNLAARTSRWSASTISARSRPTRICCVSTPCTA